MVAFCFVKNGVTMTKTELIAQLTEDMPEFTGKLIKEVVNQVLEEIVLRLEAGERVEIRHFGSWSLRVHKSRRGRNPRTGVWMTVPARAVPYFRPGNTMRQMVAESAEVLMHDNQDYL